MTKMARQRSKQHQHENGGDMVADVEQEAVNTSSPPFSPAHAFDLHGWKPDPSLSDNENYLDVVLLITRSIQEGGQQGHMGALIVRPKKTERESVSVNESSTPAAFDESAFFQNILGAATNTPLFGGKDVTSDIHAEINALGQACRSWQSTEGCTVYITIHPCKRCFAALVTFGIRRIVCRREAPPLIRDTAAEHGIEVQYLTYDEQRLQRHRIDQLFNQELLSDDGHWHDYQTASGGTKIGQEREVKRNGYKQI